MYELLYSSVATRAISENDVLDILSKARQKNKEIEVTGLLIYIEKTREFFQVLEGEKETVYQLLDVIARDERHTSVQTICEGPVTEREFKNWSMAFTRLDKINVNQLPGFSHFLEKGFTHNEVAKPQDKGSEARRLINLIRKEMLFS